MDPPSHFSSPPFCTCFLLLLAGARILEAERKQCLATVVVLCLSLLLCPRLVSQDPLRSRCHSAGFPACSRMGPLGALRASAVLTPLKGETYSELSFSGSLQLLLCVEQTFAAGLSSLGSHSSKLVQVELIPALFTSVSRNSVVFFDPPLCLVFSLCNYLPSSLLPLLT